MLWRRNIIHLENTITWRRRRMIFLQVGLVLQVESSFNAQMQTQIIAQIQQGTNPNSTRNKEKQKTLAQTEQGTRKNKRKKKTLAQIEQGTRKNKRK